MLAKGVITHQNVTRRKGFEVDLVFNQKQRMSNWTLVKFWDGLDCLQFEKTCDGLDRLQIVVYIICGKRKDHLMLFLEIL